jgi:pseudouridine-5'-phosphate glycosidase/pseudouridine kinase
MAKPSKGPVWVIGGIAVDVLGVPKSNNMSDNPSSSSSEPQLDGLSIPGQVSLSAGGVGRNIAECLSKFGVSSGLISALGGQSPNPSGLLIPSSSSSLLSSSDSSTSSSPSAKRGGLKADFFGSFLIQDCKEKDISLLHMLVPNQRTAVFSALSHPDGRFRGGVAHMGVLDFVSPNLIHNLSPRLSSAKFLVVDANVPVATIDAVLDVAEKYGVPVMFEPTSAAKAPKIAQVRKLNRLSFIKPNLTELFAIANALKSVSGASSSSSSPPPPPSSHHPHDASFNPSQEEIDTCLSILLSSGIQTVLLTMGAKGVKVARMEGSSTVSSNSRLLIESFPAETPLPLVDVNGAGDSFASGFIFGFMSGLSLQQSVKLGLRSARLTCETEKSVSPHLGSSLLMDFATSASSL